MEDLAARTRRVIAQFTERSIEEVSDETTLIDGLGLGDQLHRIELMMALEEELQIEISDAEAESLWTVGHVVTLVALKTKVAA